jgi:O-succinylbenzoate synthase
VRCPPDLLEWLQGYAAEVPDRPELTLSQAAVWALQAGREYLQGVTPEMRRRIATLAKDEKTTRAEVLRKAVQAGLIALEATSILPRL